jgi:hypothetical protein
MNILMVNPIRNHTPRLLKTPAKKRPTKEIDARVKKAVKQAKSLPTGKTTGSSFQASKKIAAEQAYLAAEKAAYAARRRAFETQQAALRAQKSAFLAQRGHMAQQAAAAKRARAAEKAKKAAERAAKKASTLRRAAKIRTYLAKTGEKKHNRLLKKYIPFSPKKKKN